LDEEADAVGNGVVVEVEAWVVRGLRVAIADEHEAAWHMVQEAREILRSHGRLPLLVHPRPP
jgi:hypothetical protein